MVLVRVASITEKDFAAAEDQINFKLWPTFIESKTSDGTSHKYQIIIQNLHFKYAYENIKI